jgi:hypothetical protein
MFLSYFERAKFNPVENDRSPVKVGLDNTLNSRVGEVAAKARQKVTGNRALLKCVSNSQVCH